MASDIVERLGDRIIADAFVAGHITSGPLAQRLARERGEAKDEIARLRAENKKLRAALFKVISACREGKIVSLGAGGMTIEAQTRNSVINRVPAWPIAEAEEELDRAALALHGQYQQQEPKP